jgi:hypothetical protein
MTVSAEVKRMSEISWSLGLINIHNSLKKMTECAKMKIQSDIVKELQAQNPGNESFTLTRT